MRAVVQRASSARVTIDGAEVGAIELGLVVLLGISIDDAREQSAWMVDKLLNLRIFTDEDDKMNRSLVDVAGAALVVSQFTLYGDTRKGRRPSFVRAAGGPEAEALYEEVVRGIRAAGVPCETGRFGAMMKVELVNDGPVTILLDSEKQF
ncbi:MAG: D-aminoacyl-tRNA deacylase [Actinomycetota bacterium]|nr:D-aminoacyl-tRNA deacylase [Actinomycetota bacterium]